MKNSPDCPVCRQKLEDVFVVCPQCGNSEIEYLDRIDTCEARQYKLRLEAKQEVWTGLAGKRQRLTDALESEKRERASWKGKLEAAKREVSEIEKQLKAEREKREGLEKQAVRLAEELCDAEPDRPRG